MTQNKIISQLNAFEQIVVEEIIEDVIETFAELIGIQNKTDDNGTSLSLLVKQYLYFFGPSDTMESVEEQVEDIANLLDIAVSSEPFAFTGLPTDAEGLLKTLEQWHQRLQILMTETS